MRNIRRKGNGQNISPITYTDPKSPAAEAYRTLRTNLGFASLDNPCRVIMVTSPGPNDGKSTIASNLAVVLAQAGHMTLLVDCDLRKPMQHKIFTLENVQGVTNCILQHLEVRQVAKNGAVENLHVLTSGPIPPNPAEILASERAKEFLQELGQYYDYIVIDSPPVLAVTDASLMAQVVDGVILVVSSHETRREAAQEAKEQLAKANARILGVVLNKVKVESPDYHYYYYYRYHYGESGEDDRRVKL